MVESASVQVVLDVAHQGIEKARCVRLALGEQIDLTEPRVQLLTRDQLDGRTCARRPSFWTWKIVAKPIDVQQLTGPREIDLFEQCTGSLLPEK